MIIEVAKDFTDTPGARYKSQGSYSGEEFRDDILYPKFIESLKENTILTVNLDGGYGYGSSFLEETFGGLVRRLKDENNQNYKKVLDIVIISNDNKMWVEKIKTYIESAIKAPKGGK